MCRYHIPRAFLNQKKNLVVVFEEVGGIPHDITILTVNRDTICSLLSEITPPSVRSWERKDNQLRPVVEDMKVGARLICPDGKVMEKVEFASFGDPIGACGMFSQGKCHATNSHKVVEEVRLQICARLFAHKCSNFCSHLFIFTALSW